MTTILNIRESQWKKDDGTETTTYWVSLDDRTKEVPCYDEKAAELKVGDTLPAGWEVKQSKAGKDYLATPKPARGGGGMSAAYRNTKEGAEAERLSIARSVALQQAVALVPGPDALDYTVVLSIADQFYAWLTSGSAGQLNTGREVVASSRPSTPPASTAPPAGPEPKSAVATRSGNRSGAGVDGTAAAGSKGGAASTGKGPAPSDDSLWQGMDAQ